MVYQVKGELTARAVDIKPIAKAFTLIEFHVSPLVMLDRGHT